MHITQIQFNIMSKQHIISNENISNLLFEIYGYRLSSDTVQN